MLFENIMDNVIKLIDHIQNKQVIIFGTGKGGKITAAILNTFHVEGYYFVDNDARKWQGSFSGVSIYSPAVLEQEDKENIIILVASSYFNEIAIQLRAYGFLENRHFFSVINLEQDTPKPKAAQPMPLLQKILACCKNQGAPDILILGDSVMSITSIHDTNHTTLCEMIRSKIPTNCYVQEIHSPGFNIGVFYTILQLFYYLNSAPSTIVLPINMRCFSPQWDLHPEFQCAEPIWEIKAYLNSLGYDLGELYDVEKKTSYDEYIKYCSTYGGGEENTLTSNSNFIAWTNWKAKDEAEVRIRYAHLFTWHYMYWLSKDNRKYLLMKKFIQLAEKMNIKLVTYITPVNYCSAEKYLGTSFLTSYCKKVEMIKEILTRNTSYDILFADYSGLLTDEYFIHRDHTCEHLNENGRFILANLISKAVMKKQIS